MKKQIEFDGTVAAAHESGMPTPSSRAPSDDVTRMTGVPFSRQYAWPFSGGYRSARVSTSLNGRQTVDAWEYDMRREDNGKPSNNASVSTPRPDAYGRIAASWFADPDDGAQTPPILTFARESLIDEAAHEASRDPVDYRLQHLDPAADAGARELVHMVAQRAAWSFAPKSATAVVSGPWLRGRGFAYDRARAGEASDTPGSRGPVWAAWVVDIEVNPETGVTRVRRVVAGQASGDPANEQISGFAAQDVERAIAQATGVHWLARPSYDETGAAGSISHDLVRAQTLAEASEIGLASGEPASRPERNRAPVAAAVANALFDATGVRFRQPPFDTLSVRDALQRAPIQTLAHAAAGRPRSERGWRRWAWTGGLSGMAGGLIGVAAALLSGHEAYAPVTPPDSTTWSAATLERGRQIALQGDCAVCHTASGGRVNAGGLALETPFGTVYSSNITPDVDTGIGTWSFAAFDRAMREGISRDGKQLYPAFPYTAFAKMSEADMIALYAYLLAQPAVAASPPQTRLPFPLNQRRLVAGWNWLFHDNTPYRPDPNQSAQWNRGKYLVDGAAHCGACHTSRNALGAERGGVAYLNGGSAEGWLAPSLTKQAAAPVRWTEAALFDYLRTGFSLEHGVAAGPMGPVVAGLAELPDTDVRAIAHYIASLSTATPQLTEPAGATSEADTPLMLSAALQRGRRTFEMACAVCHAESGGVGHFGVRPLMNLNTSVSQATPDNLLQVLHRGIDDPATTGLGYMPGFAQVFDDRQMAELAAYIRARYAPGQTAWSGLEAASAQLRDRTH